MLLFFDVTRLDLIVGQSGSKKGDAYDSKVCLASRLIKIERQVSVILRP